MESTDMIIIAPTCKDPLAQAESLAQPIARRWIVNPGSLPPPLAQLVYFIRYEMKGVFAGTIKLIGYPAMKRPVPKYL